MAIKFSRHDLTTSHLKEYRITASALPTEEVPLPQVFESTIYAINPVVARSKMSKLLKNQYKIKSTKTVFYNCDEVKFNGDFTVKNYRIEFVYRTKSGLKNGKREVRHISTAHAVSMLVIDFGSFHKIKQHEIFIIGIKQIADEEVTKERILPFVGSEVEFPVFLKERNTLETFVPASENIFN